MDEKSDGCIDGTPSLYTAVILKDKAWTPVNCYNNIASIELSVCIHNCLHLSLCIHIHQFL